VEKTLRLGLSACFFHADPKRPIFKGKTLQYLEQSLAHWLARAGNRVFLIPEPPADSAVKLADYARDLDGLVLQGGSDVAPESYGESPLRPEWAGDAHRDRYEIALVQAFRAERKPLLGICRGAQLLNVAFGGTLYQDLGTQVPGALDHRNWEIYDRNFHAIEFPPGSGLATLYGGEPRKVNTVHHQAVRELGKGLQVEAVSPRDGIIEAIRAREGPYALAVQWHPEFHDPGDETVLNDRIFLEEFMSACRERKE
jgi:putative glutamine amidotransferase